MQKPGKFYSKILITLVSSAFLATACASEQSAEERNRERRDRKIERLSRAEGKYQGTLLTKNNQSIPFALVINVNRNPQSEGDEPGLSARLRLGYFGGVDLSTDAVSFDYGSKQLSASFTPSSKAASGAKGIQAPDAKGLELQAVVVNNLLQDAKLVASSGTAYALTSVSGPAFELTDPKADLDYGVLINPDDGGKPVNALLSLTRLSGDKDAPASSDITRMPEIEATLRFPGTSAISHVADRVDYDALTDTLELYYVGGSGMRFVFSNIAQNITNASGPQAFLSEPDLNGVVELGSRAVATIKKSSESSAVVQRTKKSRLPAKNYTGTYSNGNTTSPFRVVGNMIDLGGEASAGSTIPLDRLPRLRMELSICTPRGQDPFGTIKSVLTSIDHLKSEATFKKETSEVRTYVTFSENWDNFTALVVDDQDGNNKKFQLVSSEVTDRNLTCADTVPAATTMARVLGLRDDNDEFEDGPIDDPFLTYEGYLTRANGAAVPVGLAIFPRQNPGGGTDEPSLQVTARIGFFGGANLASEPAVFNWGSGRISASFSRPTGAPLELRGILEPDTLRDAVLIGPNLGQNTLTVRKDVEPYANAGTESTFNVAISNANGPVDPANSLLSVLTLRSRSEGSTAPANIDLPVLPSIDASLRIDGLGQTPQVGSKVLYDVLRGTMEVYFSDSSVLEFTNIFLNKNTDAQRPYKMFNSLNGRMILGGQPVAAAQADDVTAGGRWTIQDLPHTIYVGTYQGGGSSHSLKALGRVDYPGNAGRNTGEYPFQTFPNLQMTVTLCLGNNAFSRRNLELEAVDYLNRRLVFKNRGTGVSNALEVEFEPRWNRLKGEFRDTDGSSGDTSGSKIDLRAIPNSSSIDCSAQIPTP